MDSVHNNDKFQNFSGCLIHATLHTPHKIAYAFLGDGERVTQQITYRQLLEAVSATAERLRCQCGEGDRILLLFDSGIEFVVAFFACLHAGMIAVPAYPPRYNRNLARAASIVQDCAPAMVLAPASLQTLLEEWRDHTPALRDLKWLYIDEKSCGATGSAVAPVMRQLHDVAFLQYTSGSTGSPKGVRVTHGNILHNERLIQVGAALSASDITVSWLPLFHDMGLIGVILQSAFNGGTCYFMTPEAFIEKPERWLRAISRYRGTFSGAPSFAFELCMKRIDQAQLKQFDLSSWRIAFNGAEPVNAEVLQAFSLAFAPAGFAAQAASPSYGMAETTLVVTHEDHLREPYFCHFERESLTHGVAKVDAQGQRLVSCGTPGIDTHIRIVDIKNGESPVEAPAVLEDGRVGEIWVASPSVADGYWQRPELNSQQFGARLDGEERSYLRTGDLGFINEGRLFVTGRLKEIIIVRGQNYYPQDIERAIQSNHPIFRSGCGIAMSVSNAAGGEHLVAVQEVRDSATEAQYQAAFTQAVQQVEHATGLLLKTLIMLKPGAIPKTSSGKLRRPVCKNMLLAGSFDNAPFCGLALLSLRQGETQTSNFNNGLETEIFDFLTLSAAPLSRNPLRPEMALHEVYRSPTEAETLCRKLSQHFSLPVDPLHIWRFDNAREFVRWYAAQLHEKPVESSFQLGNALAKMVAAPPLSNNDTVYFSSLQQQILNKPVSWAQAFLCDLLRKRVAEWLQIPAERINVRRAIFMEQELPLHVSLNLCQWLSALLQQSITQVIFYNNPTLEALALYVAEALQPHASSCADDMDWLSELEQLSEADQHALLGTGLKT